MSYILKHAQIRSVIYSWENTALQLHFISKGAQYSYTPLTVSPAWSVLLTHDKLHKVILSVFSFCFTKWLSQTYPNCGLLAPYSFCNLIIIHACEKEVFLLSCIKSLYILYEALEIQLHSMLSNEAKRLDSFAREKNLDFSLNITENHQRYSSQKDHIILG